jgi:hypothetical protein
MARSTYIYHIREPGEGLIIASFTVKYEARYWLRRSGLKRSDYNLFRMGDGLCEFGQKFETEVSWDG